MTRGPIFNVYIAVVAIYGLLLAYLFLSEAQPTSLSVYLGVGAVAVLLALRVADRGDRGRNG